MFAKRFFYVWAGLLCLALAYHLGAQSAVALDRDGPTAVGLVVYPDAMGESQWYALASNGDVYHVTNRTGSWGKNSNIFSPHPPAKLPLSEILPAKTPGSKR
ncbi:MAG TPA: hypothetical protein VGK93_06985 [Candidatus Eisenbacteria bacterium]|jgi:hypothetical protein